MVMVVKVEAGVLRLVAQPGATSSLPVNSCHSNLSLCARRVVALSVAADAAAPPSPPPRDSSALAPSAHRVLFLRADSLAKAAAFTT